MISMGFARGRQHKRRDGMYGHTGEQDGAFSGSGGHAEKQCVPGPVNLPRIISIAYYRDIKGAYRTTTDTCHIAGILDGDRRCACISAFCQP